MFNKNKALLLDMHCTFMFGEDRFDGNEDSSIYYNSISGKLPKEDLDRIIRAAYQYLDEKYPDERYRHAFLAIVFTFSQFRKINEAEIDGFLDFVGVLTC